MLCALRAKPVWRSGISEPGNAVSQNSLSSDTTHFGKESIDHEDRVANIKANADGFYFPI